MHFVPMHHDYLKCTLYYALNLVATSVQHVDIHSGTQYKWPE